MVVHIFQVGGECGRIILDHSGLDLSRSVCPLSSIVNILSYWDNKGFSHNGDSVCCLLFYMARSQLVQEACQLG